MSDVAKKVEALMEAMPYLEKYQGKVIVIKYGGNAMINDELKDAVLHDVVMLKLLGLKPVLSHGGGPGINKMLEKLNIPVQFINGLRYTSEDIMRVVEMVLVGQVNTELVGRINQIGGKAVGLSGVSGDIYPCHQFVGNEKFLMGNVDEGIVRPDIVDEFKCCNVYAKEKCRSCFAKFYCSGGCAANSYNCHGKIDDVYELGCELQKKRVECAIMIKAALADEEE